MTTLTFRRLRQAELVKWLQLRFGRSWRVRLSADMNIPVIRTYRWFKDDRCGKIQDEVETYAYKNGFVSIYDESLAPHFHHALILDDVMSKALARLERTGKAKTIPGAAFPLSVDELDQLLTGLDYKLICQR
jgi:hypothetical protein